MPSIEFNKRLWDGEYDWRARGEWWSAPWGGPNMQWYGTIFPRIRQHLPVDRILEIACGYGRWTQYLKDLCHDLILVDLSNECINACKQRFSDCSHIRYHVNDGKSLDMISDSSVDFVFSFDSLVHADESVLKAYLKQLHRIMNKNGVAFIHHSNLGEYYNIYSKIRSIPRLEGLLKRLGILEKSLFNRDITVSAKKVEAIAEEEGLSCISQEIVNWKTKRVFIDCFSTIAKKNSPFARSNRVFRNSEFMHEAQNLLQLSHLYNNEKK